MNLLPVVLLAISLVSAFVATSLEAVALVLWFGAVSFATFMGGAFTAVAVIVTEVEKRSNIK